MMFTLVPDENSMKDPLCNSSFGSMVSLDYVTPDTLFKVIQDAVLLILHYRTMSLFRTVSSSTFNTSDVQSIYNPSSIQD